MNRKAREISTAGIRMGSSSANLDGAWPYPICPPDPLHRAFPSKPVPRRQGYPAHRAYADDLPKRGRVQHGVNGRELRAIKDVVCRQSQLQRAGVPDQQGLADRHIEAKLPWAGDDIATRVSKLSGWRLNEGCDVEPIQHRRICYGDGRSRQVRTQGAVKALGNIAKVSQNSRSKGQARGDCEIAAPLPVSKDVAQRASAIQPFLSGAEGKLHEEVPGQAMPLIEAGEPAFGGEIEIVLRHHHRPAADAGGIVD